MCKAKGIFILLMSWIWIGFAQIPPGYYNNAIGLSGYNLQVALSAIIDSHQVVGYNELWNYFQYTDLKPDSTIWDIYTDPFCAFSISDHGTVYSGECYTYNREHSFCQSWFGYESGAPFSDMFHIYPVDSWINSTRNNNPYGEVNNPVRIFQNGSKFGPNSFVSSDNSTPATSAFEPIQEFKGDIARSFFYMATRYLFEDDNFAIDQPMTYQSQLRPWALEMLKNWHVLDPVSQKEIDRNNAIYSIQHNRNPFIDHPELVNLIWGNDSLSSTFTADFVQNPGKPKIVQFEIIDSVQIRLTFDTNIVSFTAENPANYSLNGGISLYSATMYSPVSVTLNLSTPLTIGFPYYLIVRNIQAANGLFVSDTSLRFSYGYADDHIVFAGWTFDRVDSFLYSRIIPAEINLTYDSALIFLNGANGSSFFEDNQLTYYGGSLIGDPRIGLADEGYALAIVNQSANQKNIVCKFSTLYWESLVLTFARRITSTGFYTYRMEWSSDGIVFYPITTINVSNTAQVGVFELQTVNLQNYYQMNRRDSVFVSISVDSATSAQGNVRLDNIAIHGQKCMETVTFFDSVYIGMPYNRYGFHISEITTFGDIILSRENSFLNACDSTIVLNLHVDSCNSWTTYLTDTVCQGSSYANFGFILPGDSTQQVGMRSDTLFLQSQLTGCDSMIVLSLTIDPVENTDFSAVACDSFRWNDNLYLQTGDYTQSFFNRYGCDSIVTLHLTVNYTLPVTYLTDTVCQGSSYSNFGFILPSDSTQQVGNRSDTLFLQSELTGCDSMVVLTLTIHPVEYTYFSAVACDSFRWNDSLYLQTGDYTQSFFNRYGCDSTVTLHLTVNYTLPVTYLADTICQGSSYANFGFILPSDSTQQVGNRSDTLFLQSQLTGCDSMVVLTLTIHPVEYTDFSAVACDSFRWNDSLYLQSGDYPQSFFNRYGCDSTVTLHLTVNYTLPVTYLTDTVCQGSSYANYGFILPNDSTQQVGNRSDTLFLQSQLTGCDSMVVLSLTIHPVEYTDFSAVACDSFRWNDSLYLQSGDYTQSFFNRYGCDSIVTLHLMVNYTLPVTYLTDTVCQGSSYSNFGFVLPGDSTQQVGNRSDTLFLHSELTGCDSMVVLSLTIHPVEYTDFSAVACDSFRWNDSLYLQTGDYTQFFFNRYSCDSIVTLHLMVNYTLPVTYLTDTVCQGSSYVNSGFVLPGDSTQRVGSRNDTLFLQSQLTDCDSMVVLCLFIETPSFIETESIDYFLVYPNPANQSIQIVGKEIAHVKIYNSIGQEIACTKSKNGSSNIRISTLHYPEGIYFLRIITINNLIISKKIVIKH